MSIEANKIANKIETSPLSNWSKKNDRKFQPGTIIVGDKLVAELRALGHTDRDIYVYSSHGDLSKEVSDYINEQYENKRDAKWIKRDARYRKLTTWAIVVPCAFLITLCIILLSLSV